MGSSDTEHGDDDNNSATYHSRDEHLLAELALIDNICLDSAASSGDETVGSDDRGTDSEDEGAYLTDEEMDAEGYENKQPMDPGRWFNGTDLGIIPPVPTHQAEDQQPQYLAGCKWTSENWSCPYDAVFMSFWSIYKQSSPRWREDWVECSPDWNGPLGDNFDHLILLTRTPLNTDDQAAWFSRYRDHFRDQLSRADSESFPRWGPATAPAVRILRFIFGRFNGPYVEQDLICLKCRAPSRAKIDICFLIGGLQRNLRNLAPSLDVIWEEFLRRYETKPFHQQARCHCNGQNRVERLSMPAPPGFGSNAGRLHPLDPL